ncbi:hypothetical protein E2C01_079458 [Portunus trituberculatus]|uniref:Uncharacterized protein n=1 Tax=Portunus trituberculatus TaxID=210409 RepID=A0A5B7IGZ7_PORTR|nr:hypothetical protein [Portunus trituberculatus]
MRILPESVLTRPTRLHSQQADRLGAIIPHPDHQDNQETKIAGN